MQAPSNATEQEPHHATSDAVTLASILQPLVDSGYIGAKEVGRIAQSSSEMNEVTMEDTIWASFCRREYPGTDAFERPFLEQKGYRWLYKRWSGPIVKRRALLPLSGSPSCTEAGISFFVHVKYDGRLIYKDCYIGEGLYLWEYGAAKFPLDEPIKLGQVQWNYTQNDLLEYESNKNIGLPVTCHDFDENKVSVSIHVLRQNSSASDTAMTRVFDSTIECACTLNGALRAYPLVADGETITHQSKIDYDKEQRTSILQFRQQRAGITMLPLRNSANAMAILERLGAPVYFDARVSLQVVKGGHLAVTSYMIEAMKEGTNGARPGRFESAEEAKENGVSLLHILSELKDV